MFVPRDVPSEIPLQIGELPYCLFTGMKGGAQLPANSTRVTDCLRELVKEHTTRRYDASRPWGIAQFISLKTSKRDNGNPEGLHNLTAAPKSPGVTQCQLRA